MLEPRSPSSAPGSSREQLVWAASLSKGYGRPGAHATSEPIFSALPALTEAVAWAVGHGDRADVELALLVADVLGAAWERLGEHALGRERLDAVLAAATRTGLSDQLAVARVLRRRARLAMAAGVVVEADEDLQRAYAIAAAEDDGLTLRLVLDRADLAMRCGAWDVAEQIVPELLRRTQDSGDPLLRAMGLNRSGWCAFGQGQRALSQQRYEQAWALADLHEDPVVEARTASGLGLLTMLREDPELALGFWRRALELAERVHDRAFTLHCLDGVSALLVLRGDDLDGARLGASVTAVRATLTQVRDQAMVPLHELVLRHTTEPVELWSYAEAVAFARRVVGASV